MFTRVHKKALKLGMNPTMSSLNAVLKYVPHNYMFFCAKDDFSGYHAFASTYDQHLINARKFQKALDRRGIHS